MAFRGGQKTLWILLIAVVASLAVHFVSHLTFFRELEWKTFDLRTRLFARPNPAEEVAVVLIDDSSLRMMAPTVGRWPWPRSIHADVIDFLSMGGAESIVFDLMFTETEGPGGVGAESLGPGDRRLAEATASADNVFHAGQFVSDVEDNYNPTLLDRSLPGDFSGRFAISGYRSSVPPRAAGNAFDLPFPELYRSSKGVGIIEFSPDSDGVYRRTLPVRRYGEQFFPVLSLAVLLEKLHPERVSEEKRRLRLTGIDHAVDRKGAREEEFSVPLRNDGSYLVKMYQFRPFSLSGILASIQRIKKGKVENLAVHPEEFLGKTVFIGASAAGLEDLKATSLRSRTPGVFLHASIYGNILHRDFLSFPDRSRSLFLILFLSAGAALSVSAARHVALQVTIPSLLGLGYLVLTLAAFQTDLVLPLAAPLSGLVLSCLGVFAYLGSTEGRDKRKIRKILGQYVSPAVMEKVLSNPSRDLLRAEVGGRENLTILFSDIRGFTSLSEVLEAEAVVDLLNGYFSGMVDNIFLHQGTLDKFIGDAILAFWGAPVRVGDHAGRAVAAAVEMVRWLKMEYNPVLRQKGLAPLEIGIGIHTGEVVLGNIGSEKKLDYTIIGDNVNLCSRLEGLTKSYGCPILISEFTRRQLNGSFICRIVDSVRVKGKREPVEIYEVLGQVEEGKEKVVANRRISALTREGFDLYRRRDWDGAIGAYSEVLRFRPHDSLSRIFVKRCEDYLRRAPREDWDGVHLMQSK